MAVGGSDALAALSMDTVLAVRPDTSPLLSASAVLPAACTMGMYRSHTHGQTGAENKACRV